MKKLLLLGLLSTAAISTSARDANAWFLDCCCRDRCNKCTTTLCCRPYNAFTPVCCGNICCDGCMPINMCGGCCPQQQRSCLPSCFSRQSNGGCCSNGGCGSNGCGSNGCCFNGGYSNGCCNNGCYPNGCYPNNCCDMGCLPAPGSFQNVPQGGAPLQIPMMPGQPMPQANPGQQFVAPNPQIMNPSSFQPQMQMPMQMQPNYGFTPVQPIAYYPGYQQQYNPYAYPMAPANYYPPMQAPGYWYGR